MKQIVVPSWITLLKVVEVENNEQVDLKDEPSLEGRFKTVLEELEDIKGQTRCGSCKRTFGSMLELGYNYEKTQKLIDLMQERSYSSWNDVPEEDKKKFKDAVEL